MKTRTLARSLLLAVLVTLAGSAPAAVLDVPGTYPTIQDAVVAAAPSGDRIHVATGVYTSCVTTHPAANGLNCFVIDNKDLCLIAIDGPGTVVIDPLGVGRGALLRLTETSIHGFDFVNGDAPGQAGVPANGGAILALESDYHILDCTFQGNTADNGGAVMSFGGHANFRYCFFDGNIASNTGGGFGVRPAPDSGASASFMRTRFRVNDAQRGGAISTAGNAVVVHVAGGRCIANTASVVGGAIHAGDGSEVWCCNTLLDANVAPPGAGEEGYIVPGATVDMSCCTYHPAQWVGTPLVDTNLECPDLSLSTATTAATTTASIYNVPDCTGLPFSGAFGSPATITVTMINCLGAPIPGLTRDHFWLEETTKDDFAPCKTCCTGINRFPIADGATDAAGITYFDDPVCAGGFTDPAGGERIVVNTAWGVMVSPPIDIQFNSPDLTSDGVVNLADIATFVGILPGPYEYRADFVWDGAINLSDIVIMSMALGAACADDCP